MKENQHRRGRFILVMTCSACPEQYDVYLDGMQVGYLRLRHGTFTVDCPFGETIFTGNPNGDGVFGYDERDIFLDEAIARIDAKLKRESEPDEGFSVQIDLGKTVIYRHYEPNDPIWNLDQEKRKRQAMADAHRDIILAADAVVNIKVVDRG